MLADARSLAHYGLVDSGQLAELKGANGIKNVAQDLQILAIAMQANWANIQGYAPTTGPAQLATATDQRLRAFTLVLNVYEDTRRAVGYLRAREGDADSIAPALYPGRPATQTSGAATAARKHTAHDAAGSAEERDSVRTRDTGRRWSRRQQDDLGQQSGPIRFVRAR